MKRSRPIVFVVLFLCGVAFGQGSTYAIFGVSDVWSNAANWSAGVPDALDTGVFRGDSLQGQCRVDQPFKTRLYFDVDDPPDNAFNDGGFPCTTLVPMRFVGDGGVSCTLSGTWVTQQSGTFAFDTGLVYEVDSVLVYLEGTNDTLENISGAARYIKRLVFGDEALDTMHFLATTDAERIIPRQLGGKGVFHHGSSVDFISMPLSRYDFSSYLDTSSYQIISSSTGNFSIESYATGVGFDLPKINALDFYNMLTMQIFIGQVNLRGGVFVGDESTGGIFRVYIGVNFSWNTNNHPINVYQYFMHQDGTSPGNTYYGSSVVDIGEGGYKTATRFGLGTQDEWQTSTWYCAGDFLRWAYGQVNPGTSVITMDGPSAAILQMGRPFTGSSQYFHDLIIDKSGAGSVTVLQAGPTPRNYPIYTTTLTVLDGDFDMDKHKLLSVSDQSYTASVADFVTVDSLDSMTGDGDFIFASSVGTFNFLDCDLNLLGTGNFQNSSGATRTIKRLRCAYPGKTTTCVSNEIRLLNAGVPLILNGGTLTVASMNLHVRPTVNCQFLDVTASTLNVNHFLSLEPYAGGLSDTIPRLTAGGSGEILIVYNTNTDTVIQADTLETSGSYSVTSKDPGSVYDFAGQLLKMTSGAEVFKFGVSEGDGYLRLQGSKGIVDIVGSIQSTSFNDAFTDVYSDSATWRFGGSFTLGTGTNWIPDGGLIEAIGTGSQLMTLNVDTVDAVRLSKPSGDFSTVGQFACLYFDIDSGLHVVDGDTLDVQYRYGGSDSAHSQHDSLSWVVASGPDFILLPFPFDTLAPVQALGDILRVQQGGGIGRLICGGDSVLYDTTIRVDFADYRYGDWDGYMNDTSTFWTTVPSGRCTLTAPSGDTLAPNRIRMRDCVWPENIVMLEYDSGAIDWGGNY